MQVPMSSLKVARVLHKDDEFYTLEVGRTDNVSFHLRQDESGETVGGDEFLTILFVHANEQGGMEVWDPLAP